MFGLWLFKNTCGIWVKSPITLQRKVENENYCCFYREHTQYLALQHAWSIAICTVDCECFYTSNFTENPFYATFSSIFSSLVIWILFCLDIYPQNTQFLPWPHDANLKQSRNLFKLEIRKPRFYFSLCCWDLKAPHWENKDCIEWCSTSNSILKFWFH